MLSRADGCVCVGEAGGEMKQKPTDAYLKKLTGTGNIRGENGGVWVCESIV